MAAALFQNDFEQPANGYALEQRGVEYSSYPAGEQLHGRGGVGGNDVLPVAGSALGGVSMKIAARVVRLICRVSWRETVVSCCNPENQRVAANQ